MRGFTRTAIFLLIGLAIFGGAYLGVALLLPDPAVVGPGPAQVVRPAPPRAADGTIGDVEGVTLRTHDPATGAPVAEIHVGEYRRKSDSQIDLTRITATILAGEGLVTLNAPTGRVDVEAAADRRDRLDADTLGLADVARLRDVTLRYYAVPSDAAAGPGAAQFTLRVDNLVFDNSRFSLYTDDTTIDGRTVLADDVPVYVRGRDYDFDGRGLLVRWDGNTRQPTLFRIAKGQSLTIKDGTALLPKPVAAAAVQPPVLLASADSKAAVGQVVQATRPTTRPLSVYRATLQKDVVVTQRGEPLLRADAAAATFATVPNLAVSDSKPAAPRKPATTAAPASQRASTGPARAAVDKAPVFVTWEGELRVVLVAGEPVTLRDADDVRLRMDGSPLVLRQNGSEVRAPTLFYDRGGDELRLVSDPGEITAADLAAGPSTRPAARVTLLDDAGNTLAAQTLVAHPDAGDATAYGEGYADVPDDAGRRVRVRWDESCAFAFDAADGGKDKTLRRVSARGAVNVTHPDFLLDSDTLDLALAPAAMTRPTSTPTTKPAGVSLQSVRAAGDVRCELSSAAEGLTGLTCDRLRIDIADKSGPTRLTADGHVRTRQQNGDLSADALTADLRQKDDGGYDLQSLLARGNVIGSDAEGRRLAAATMTVTPTDDGRHLRLEGTAETPATVTRGDDVLAGPVLTFDDARQSFAVPQPGRLDTRQQRGDAPPLPIRVTWNGSLNGDEQKVVADGGVTVKGGDATSKLDLTAATATLDLTPQTRAATAPTSKPAADRDMLGSLRRVTLDGDVRATAEELDGDALTRSFDLRSRSLVATPAGGQDVAVVIDTPGRMLYRDLRPADAEDKDAGPAAGFRGNAAFGWQGRLDWSPGANVMTMSDRATVAVEPAGRPAFNLTADRFRVVTAQIGGRRDIVSAAADGSSTFTTKGLKFDADHVDYDPLAETVTARGTAGSPVIAYDDRGVPTGRFGSLVYDLKTAQVERVTNVNAGG